MDVCEKNYEDVFAHYLNGPDTAPIVPAYTHRKLNPVFCLFAKAVYTALKHPDSSVGFFLDESDELNLEEWDERSGIWPRNLTLWPALSREEEHLRGTHERGLRASDFMFITDVARWKYPCNYGKSSINESVMKQVANNYLRADIVKDVPEKDWERLDALSSDGLYIEWFRRRGTTTALLVKALYLAVTNYKTPIVFMCQSQAHINFVKQYLKGSYPKNLVFRNMTGSKESCRGLEKSIFVFDIEIQHLIQNEIKRITSDFGIESIVKQIVY